MMMSQILISVVFTKTEKSRYPEKTFFLQIKKFIKGYIMAKNKFVAEVNFKNERISD